MQSLTIGFDLGSREAAWAILFDGALVSWQSWQQLEEKAKLDQRLGEFAWWVREAIKMIWDNAPYRAEVTVGIERPYAKWPRAVEALYRQFGIVEATTRLVLGKPPYGKRCTIHGITPAEAKQALTGRGDASKEAMIQAVQVQFGCDLNEHEADAAGVALAAWVKQKERGLGEIS